MSSCLDTMDKRATGLTKADTRTPLQTDIDELGFAMIEELRKRGHDTHAVEIVHWKTPKVMSCDPLICISVPKVSA